MRTKIGIVGIIILKSGNKENTIRSRLGIEECAFITVYSVISWFGFQHDGMMEVLGSGEC